VVFMVRVVFTSFVVKSQGWLNTRTLYDVVVFDHAVL
jgi:hypothetical protein